MDDEVMRTRKAKLRRTLGAARASSAPDVRALADEGICDTVCSSGAWRRARVVMTYLSLGAEVSTRGIIARSWSCGKSVALPWCVPGTRDLRWFVVDSLDGLVRGPLGVEEPDPATARELAPSGASHADAVAIVPGLTFDARGYRLGYGGGYYDRFLDAFGGRSLGLCRDAQLSEDLRALGVVGPHDRPVELVATESGLMGAP
ncbi:5-formyltetrahydrofolate cyclo-ligase [Olsenella massiliensis]|uniref:5-formyltetrahydrofolate cyclo-ligase n=1 Tax=Olsenella massiliensis TaxID=1622075 RepID=UPI00071D4E07|nr:5-formyltetrahydrofolate cyclo-ligase [Olsenella massiliensis]